jgi:hypothetical protein
MPDTTDALIEGLRAWTREHDAHVRAAVELIIWHGFWLRRADFRTAGAHGPRSETEAPSRRVRKHLTVAQTNHLVC